ARNTIPRLHDRSSRLLAILLFSCLSGLCLLIMFGLYLKQAQLHGNGNRILLRRKKWLEPTTELDKHTEKLLNARQKLMASPQSSWFSATSTFENSLTPE
ncbi:unnamed protein product, partial [Didymodactylos carnosus]